MVVDPMRIGSTNTNYLSIIKLNRSKFDEQKQNESKAKTNKVKFQGHHQSLKKGIRTKNPLRCLVRC